MDRKQEPDVYGMIRSPEIRSFLRKNDCMGIFGKEQIILQSYISAQQKMEMLKKLSMSGDKEEVRLVYETYRVYESCMAGQGYICRGRPFKVLWIQRRYNIPSLLCVCVSVSASLSGYESAKTAVAFYGRTLLWDFGQ